MTTSSEPHKVSRPSTLEEFLACDNLAIKIAYVRSLHHQRDKALAKVKKLQKQLQEHIAHEHGQRPLDVSTANITRVPTMMGAKEATDVQDKLAAAMGLLSEIQHIVIPHSQCGDIEAVGVKRAVYAAVKCLEDACNALDLEDGDTTVPRPAGCTCHWEQGDSPCPVHGEDET